VSDDDSDTDQGQEATMTSGVLEGIVDVDPYLSCPKPTCTNSKLITVKGEDNVYRMSCKICNNVFMASVCNNYIRTTMMLKTDEETKKVVLFQPQLTKLFQSRGLDSTILYDKSEMIKKMMQILPIEIKFHLTNSTIRNLICKRIA